MCTDMATAESVTVDRRTRGDRVARNLTVGLVVDSTLRSSFSIVASGSGCFSTDRKPSPRCQPSLTPGLRPGLIENKNSRGK